MSSGTEHWTEGGKPARDWKKLLLVIGLGLLSWVATYVGMLELIEANMGDLPILHKVIIGFSVAMLMTMVVWLLDQIFAPIGWITRLSYVAGYLFLTLISVGFGFGFYWKVLESRSVASSSAESAVTQVQNALFSASTRLEQLQGTLDQLVTISKQKAATEQANGSSCPNSKPGEGPRRRLREEDAARFGFAGDFVKARAGAVRGEMAALDADLVKIVSDDKSIVDAKSGTRNEFMKSLGRKLELTATGFNTFRSDAQLKQIRADLAERADRQSFADGRGGSFLCPDAQLQTALKGVVRAIDELPALEKPKITTVEGSEAVIEAFRRLTATFYGALAFKMPPTAEELRDLQRKAMETAGDGGAKPKAQAYLEQPGLSKRDYIPLSIAVFVDLCLLLVSIGRPVDRMQGLLPKMRAAERGPIIQILSRFNQIHRDEEIRENFEIFRHVVFDFNGDYYVAVPLDAPTRINPAEREQLRVEATILANLFASFEQERVFSRVLMPLLSSNAIRRKLRRQGSKFAEAEAFRVYKFRDGAWSEFILGAVMGAAKRVEADKLRRHVEGEIFDTRGKGPRLAEHAAPIPPAPMEDLPSVLAASPRLQREAEALASFSGGRREHGRASMATSASAAATAAAAPEASMTADAHARRFGPYARFNRREEPAEEATAVVHHAGPRPETSFERHQVADAPVRAATGRNASDAESAPAYERRAVVGPADDMSNVIPLPGTQHPGLATPAMVERIDDLSATSGARPPSPMQAGALAQPSVRVEATERKVVYQMPASDFVLPAVVAEMAARSISIAAAARRFEAMTESAQPAIERPVPAQLTLLLEPRGDAAEPGAIAHVALGEGGAAWPEAAGGELSQGPMH